MKDPKEKALEIVTEIKAKMFSDGHYDAKRIGQYMCNEIIEQLRKLDYQTELISYWAAVKNQIKMIDL